MIVSENLKKNNIILDVAVNNRWQLFSVLLDLAVKNGEIKQENRDDIAEALALREKTMSTSIGKGVAIPHCMSSKVDKIVIMLAVLKNELKFDAVDKQPVSIAVLLLVPDKKASLHVKALTEIARIMNDEETRNKILNYKTAGSILKLINDFDSNKQKAQ